MIEENGQVVGIEEDYAVVETVRSSSCGSCSSKGCGTGALTRYFASKAHEVRARNSAGAAVGDRVVLGIPESTLLRGSVAVYLVPLLTMILGGLFGQAIAPQLGLAATGDGVSAISGLLGLGLGFLWLRWHNARVMGNSRYEAVVVRRLGAAVQPMVFHSAVSND